MKIMVDQKLVKKLLASGLKSYTIEKQYKIPRSVTEDIAKGRSRPFYNLFKRIKLNKDDMCEVCGTRKKHPGFLKMCIVCFKQNTDDAAMDSPHEIRLR